MLQQEGGSELLSTLETARGAALDTLEKEFKAVQRTLRRGAPPDGSAAVDALAAAAAKLVADMHASCTQASEALVAKMEKEHKQLLEVLRGQSGLMIGDPGTP